MKTIEQGKNLFYQDRSVIKGLSLFLFSEFHKVQQCIYDNIQGCDVAVENSVLSEVKVIQTMAGSLSCPVMPWCDNPVNQSVVVQEMCSGTVTCSLDWNSCVAFTNFAYCL